MYTLQPLNCQAEGSTCSPRAASTLTSGKVKYSWSYDWLISQGFFTMCSRIFRIT
jgi:hypothetical protein